MKMQETDIEIFRKIVSLLAYDVVSLDDNGGLEWDELSDCILSFAKTQPLKAFHLFVELPRLYWRFIEGFMESIVEEAEKVLVNLKEDNVEDWSLSLEALVKMSIQILDSDNVEDWRLDLVKCLLFILVKSVKELVKKGMEEFVRILRGSCLETRNCMIIVMISVFSCRLSCIRLKNSEQRSLRSPRRFIGWLLLARRMKVLIGSVSNN